MSASNRSAARQAPRVEHLVQVALPHPTAMGPPAACRRGGRDDAPEPRGPPPPREVPVCHSTPPPARAFDARCGAKFRLQRANSCLPPASQGFCPLLIGRSGSGGRFGPERDPTRPRGRRPVHAGNQLQGLDLHHPAQCLLQRVAQPSPTRRFRSTRPIWILTRPSRRSWRDSNSASSAAPSIGCPWSSARHWCSSAPMASATRRRRRFAAPRSEPSRAGFAVRGANLAG